MGKNRKTKYETSNRKTTKKMEGMLDINARQHPKKIAENNRIVLTLEEEEKKKKKVTSSSND